MKILEASQLAELDQYSIQKQHIRSWELMERAARRAYESLRSDFNLNGKIHVLAGPGNNGGDGLAMAYFMSQDKYDVDVHLVNFTNSRSEDNQKNLQRLQDKTNVNILELTAESRFPQIDAHDLVIDAIFGIGLNRSMPQFVHELIRHINTVAPTTIAVDVPSGMYIDSTPASHEEVFQADMVYTFQTPKLSLCLPDYAPYVGSYKMIDIGLDLEYWSSMPSSLTYVDSSYAKRLYKPRSRFSHKGTYGHAVLVGGSRLMLGSVVLAAKSCMRSGVGKTSVMMPQIGQSLMIHHQPEAMLIDNDSTDFISRNTLDFLPDAIGIGVGIGTTEESYRALKHWLESSAQPLVIDADALNLIAQHTDLKDIIPKHSILTPHPGELKRLIGNWDTDFDKISLIKAFSKTYNVIVLAKDAFSLCVNGNQVYVNSTGNSGMATAGSGDVLTGLITGLLAQNYAPLHSAILGMFLHGNAGDLALKVTSEEALIASDLINHLGKSFKHLS